MNAVIIGDTNKRAAIACLRGLRPYDIEVHLAFRDSSDFRNRLIYAAYLEKERTHRYSAESKNDFIESLIAIRKKVGEYRILPIGESLVRWLSEESSFLHSNGIYCNVAPPEVYRRLSNKNEFVELCRKYDLPVPEEFILDGASEFSVPFVVKAKSGEKGERILKFPLLVENEDSFSIFRSRKLDLDRHFYQKLIVGPSIYYCALYESGEKKLEFCEINLAQQPDGKSVVKAAPDDCLPETLVAMVDGMFADLGYDGPMMFEFKRCNSSGIFFAIECNPRLWGPLQLAIDNGKNFPAVLCGLDSKSETAPNFGSCGYLWRGGFLDGLFLKKSSKTRFQRFPTNGSIAFRDVWWRSDTLLYAVLEPFIIVGGHLLGLKK